jgi:hypothetical protein
MLPSKARKPPSTTDRTVTAFPNAFYTPSGVIDLELLKEIFTSGARRANVRYGAFLKNLCRLLVKTEFPNPETRLMYLARELPKRDVRINLYNRCDVRSDSKSLLNKFYHNVYLYVIDRYPEMDAFARYNSDFFIYDDTKVFFNVTNVQLFIRRFKSEKIDVKSLSLYLWAFQELHAWDRHDDIDSNYLALHTSIQTVLGELNDEALKKYLDAHSMVLEER